MDGVSNNSGILIIAATNREDLLDPALIRSGRFDLKINFDVPSTEQKKELFELYLRKLDSEHFKNIELLINDENFIAELVKNSKGLTGANIEDIINKTASVCYSKDSEELDKNELKKILKKTVEENEMFRKYEERNKGNIFN